MTKEITQDEARDVMLNLRRLARFEPHHPDKSEWLKEAAVWQEVWEGRTGARQRLDIYMQRRWA